MSYRASVTHKLTSQTQPLISKTQQLPSQTQLPSSSSISFQQIYYLLDFIYNFILDFISKHVLEVPHEFVSDQHFCHWSSPLRGVVKQGPCTAWAKKYVHIYNKSMVHAHTYVRALSNKCSWWASRSIYQVKRDQQHINVNERGRSYHDQGEWVKIPLFAKQSRKRSGTNCRVMTVRLNALNVPHIPWPCFIAPKLRAFLIAVRNPWHSFCIHQSVSW